MQYWFCSTGPVSHYLPRGLRPLTFRLLRVCHCINIVCMFEWKWNHRCFVLFTRSNRATGWISIPICVLFLPCSLLLSHFCISSLIHPISSTFSCQSSFRIRCRDALCHRLELRWPCPVLRVWQGSNSSVTPDVGASAERADTCVWTMTDLLQIDIQSVTVIDITDWVKPGAGDVKVSGGKKSARQK